MIRCLRSRRDEARFGIPHSAKTIGMLPLTWIDELVRRPVIVNVTVLVVARKASTAF